MKNVTDLRFTILSFVVLSSVLMGREARANLFEISSVPGAGIRFVGNGTTATYSFFNDGDGNSFQIDSVIGGWSAVGYKGTFYGSWTLGPVTTVNLVPLVETAPVTGSGTLVIHGPGGDDLTSEVTWTQASSLRILLSSGVIGIHGHLLHVEYSGTDPDLIGFSVGGSGAEYELAFNFEPPGKSLKQLVSSSDNPKSTVFSGQLIGCGCPDTGATCLLLGTSVAGLVGLRWNTERQQRRSLKES